MTSIARMHHRPAGFSLIELLVAILIVSVLAVLSSMALSGLSDKGKSTTCLNNLRTLTQGIAAYAVDHSMKYPAYEAKETSYYAWYAPLIGTGFGNPPYVPHRGAGKKIAPYFCQKNPASASGGSGQWTNYAMNYYLIGAKASIVNGVKVLLFDSYQPGKSPGTHYLNQGGVGVSGQSKTWADINPVHGDYINVSFTDGHAQPVRIYPTIESSPDLNELKASWFWPY